MLARVFSFSQVIRCFIFSALLQPGAEVATAQNSAPKPRPVQGIGSDDDPTRQTEKDWVDDRWNKMNVGPFLSGTIQTPGRPTYKGIVIKVGDLEQGAVCFDTELMRYSSGWVGGFLELNPQRYGLIVASKPKGQVQFQNGSSPGWAKNGDFADPRKDKLGPLPQSWSKYKGLYLHKNRIGLRYSMGNADIVDSPWLEEREGLQVFTRTLQIQSSDSALELKLFEIAGANARIENTNGVTVLVVQNGEMVTAAVSKGSAQLFKKDGAALARIAPTKEKALERFLIWSGSPEAFHQFVAFASRDSEKSDFQVFASGGPARWIEPVVTRGQVEMRKGTFVVDTLTLPFKNPWNALMFTSGHDFFANGDIAVCTAHGDVWRVSGVDQKLERLNWKRYATGLYQPLGLKIIEDKVYVLGRDQLTRLHDFNGDNEADYYENFNNDCYVAGGGHSYATCLETDREGNFYYLKCAEGTPHGGTVIRVSKDGGKLDVLATGFRNPNGMGISPENLITVTDQQGDWVPETRLDVIKEGGFYGYMPMHKRLERPSTYDAPLCWIPRTIDNSAGGQTWVPENLWGPLGRKMIHLSFGRCSLMAVLQDERNPTAQGAVVPLPGRFLSGAMRGRFSPHDGNLYVTGLRGWQTSAVADGCLQRVRYTGEPLYLPAGFEVQPQGIKISFSQAVERIDAEDTGSYAIEAWNYKWSEQYGSPDFTLTDSNKEGRDKVELNSAKLLEDGKSVLLHIPSLREAMQMQIQYSLSSGGKPMRGSLYLTINKIPKM